MKKIVNLLHNICLSWPNASFGDDPEGTVKQYSKILGEFSEEELDDALTYIIKKDRSPYQPALSRLYDVCDFLVNKQGKTAQEAWEDVLKALRYSRNRSAEMYAGLPVYTQKVIGSPEKLQRMSSLSEFDLNEERKNFYGKY